MGFACWLVNIFLLVSGLEVSVCHLNCKAGHNFISIIIIFVLLRSGRLEASNLNFSFFDFTFFFFFEKEQVRPDKCEFKSYNYAKKKKKKSYNYVPDARFIICTKKEIDTRRIG